MQREIQFKPGRQFIARFLPGKDLHEAIIEFCKKNNIKAGYIPMCIGGIKNPEIINPDPKSKGSDAQPVIKKFSSIMEFSASGTIALDTQGNYINHLHIITGGDKHKLICMGHLAAGEIAILTEIVIIEAENIEAVRDIDQGVFPKPLLFFKSKVD